MADLKISQLTGASTPLAGTEVLPIVQSGSTVKVSVANLTAGRAVGMAGGSFTDNITQSTAAKGVNFTANTPAAGMTSQLLNWYEDGTWTPTLVTTGTNFTSVTYAGARVGKYTRIGRVVTVEGIMVTSSVTVGAASGVVRIGGLPYAGLANGASIAVGYADGWAVNVPIAGIFQANSTIQLYYRALANGPTVDTPVSDVATGANGNYLYFSGSYTL